jgi:phosphate ABC transporter phosphate-binding protein
MTRRPRLTALRLAALGVVLAATAGVLASPSVMPAAADGYVPITGTGSTWSQNALDQWRKNVAANYGMTVNYSGVGSSAGRRDYLAGTVDFAVSEIPFQLSPEDGSAPETFTAAAERGYAYMPIVAGGTAFMYNLKINGARVTNLRLSGEVITKIFTGRITNWNDPAIQADNPGLTMPDKAIVPVVRSDGSGSTAQFTLWMSKQYSSIWQGFLGRSGLTSQYPLFGNAKGQNGSLGVAGYVSQDYGEGAITYVEYSYAMKSGFPVVKVLNNSGYYVEPTAPSVAVALMAAQINTDAGSPDYLTQILDGVYNNGDSRTYPLSSYSYMIVPVGTGGVFTSEKGATLGAFARYMLCEGQQQAPALGYSPLPMNLVIAGSEQIKRIPGAGSAGIDFSSCNNPTFRPGDDAGSNLLAETAPYPPDCDKVGSTQCATGTGGASETPTDTAGGGTGGTTTGGTTTGVTTTGGSSPVYDENGNLISGGSGNAAVSAPFKLRQDAFGPAQWLMVGAIGLLLAAIALPPLLSRRLKRPPTS